jgi:hypothetical protein
MKPSVFAAAAAAMTSRSDAPGRPYAMFSRTLPVKSSAFC